jgi:hypothetical protein
LQWLFILYSLQRDSYTNKAVNAPWIKEDVDRERKRGAMAKGRFGSVAEGRFGSVAEKRFGSVAEKRFGSVAEGREKSAA